MHRFSPSTVHNLLAAAEAVGNDERVTLRLAYSRQQYPLTDGHRDVVFILLKAKGAGQTAAARIEQLSFKPHLFKELLLVFHSEKRLLVAVAVQQRFAA